MKHNSSVVSSLRRFAILVWFLRLPTFTALANIAAVLLLSCILNTTIRIDDAHAQDGTWGPCIYQVEPACYPDGTSRDVQTACKSIQEFYSSKTYSLTLTTEYGGVLWNCPYDYPYWYHTSNVILAECAGADGYPTLSGCVSQYQVKNLGEGSCLTNPKVGDPITVCSGNKYELKTDYQGAGNHRLIFTRYYNSLGTQVGALGLNWRHSYERSLTFSGSTQILVNRPDGQIFTFNQSGSSWISDTDVPLKLTAITGGYTLINNEDDVETYDKIHGLLQSIKQRDGYTQTLSYKTTANTNNITPYIITSVTDSFGRRLTFAYDTDGNLLTMTDPDSHVYSYGYAAAFPSSSAPTVKKLITVAYPTIAPAPRPTITYLYENATYPLFLTGVTDELGQRYATWNYDSSGRVILSKQAGDTDVTTLAFNGDGTTTVTFPLGEKITYTFWTLQDASKIAQESRAAAPGIPAASRSYQYDSYGFLSQMTDWNGNVTTYVNNSRGLQTSRTEAFGTPLARTITTTWHPTFRLPTQIVEPGRTTNFAYDGNGNLLTRKETDTQTQTNGATRSWTWTYDSLGDVLTENGPRTDVTDLTKFTYDSLGRLTAVINALGQATKITASTTSGLPKTVVDPNGVTTTLAYDARQHLTSSSIATAAGARTTSFTYDAAGNLLRTIRPDGSLTATAYDAAQRPIRTADAANEQINTALDALGDPTRTSISTAGGAAVVWQTLRKFDALGRLSVTQRGAGQTTSFAYDGNGNVIKVTDPKGRVTTRALDALDRVTKITDPAGGVTGMTYDAHDRLTGVVASNGATTSYSYDGFGDLIRRISPDSGATYFYYDLAGNLIQTTDAAGIVTQHSYDALNRLKSTTYPGNAAENVAYAYDVSGHGFGTGRLTNVTDAVGSLSLNYEERGLETGETRTHGGVTLTTKYGYDAAGRVASIAYPSGTGAAYAYNATGKVGSVTIKAPGVAAPGGTLAVSHAPFGPVTALVYGNGLAEARAYDADYRLTSLRSGVQSLSYGYDAADNVTALANGITPADSQAFGYDTLDHLTAARGVYGSRAWSYDLAGNRLTETAGGPTGAVYSYLAKSNRLIANTAGGLTTDFAYTATGNLAAITPATGAAQSLKYTQGQRLASVATGATALGSYAYDAFGQRFGKVTKTTTTLFAYDQTGHLLEEADGSGHGLADTIYLEGVPVARVAPQTGVLSYLHTDRLGTPQLATSATKSLVWGANYEPFGQPTVTPSGSITQNMRFPGQYADAETGWNQNSFRDYAPLLGRYLESDPIGLRGGINTYGYVGGNPVAQVDSSGLSFFNLDSDSYGRDFSHIRIAIKVLRRFVPPGASLRGPLRFLDIDAAVGQIYADLNLKCDSSRSKLVRTLDAAGDIFAIASAYNKIFVVPATLFSGEALIDQHIDYMLDMSGVDWIFTQFGLGY